MEKEQKSTPDKRIIKKVIGGVMEQLPLRKRNSIRLSTWYQVIPWVAVLLG